MQLNSFVPEKQILDCFSKTSAFSIMDRACQLSQPNNPLHVKNRLRSTYLTIQYRFNHQIMRWPNQSIYQNKLTAAELNQNLCFKNLEPVKIYNLESREKLSSEKSYVNELEAEAIVQYLMHLHKKFLSEGTSVSADQENKNQMIEISDPASTQEKIKLAKKKMRKVKLSDIGIIVPYAAQKRLIISKLKASFGHYKESVLLVDTVDAFQGNERKIILISLVRSNSYQKIGFLNDIRRFNVSVTRAKLHLAVFCNVLTFRHAEFSDFFNMHEIEDINSENLSENFPEPDSKFRKKRNFRGIGVKIWLR